MHRIVRDGVCRFASKIRLNSGELSGAFGDLGTDLPLLTGMVLASGMDAGWVFLVFGLMQIAAALFYGIPMPVQPLKAVAALVIAQNLGAGVIAGGALAIALLMLLLTLTGTIDVLGRIIPVSAIRGIQLGLGLKLALLALGKYLPSEGIEGWLAATAALVILLILMRQKRFPAGVAALLIGAFYALTQGVDLGHFRGFALPSPPAGIPSANDFWIGFILLAVPQVPLSLGNSVLATERLAQDWFPESCITVRKIGASYSVLNLFAGFLGGVPVCHGSGGMAGHYALGARTGGSTATYGIFYLALAAAACAGYQNITRLFPLPILGVILLIEGATLMRRLSELPAWQFDWLVALGVGLIACFLPYGFLTGLIVGAFAPVLRSHLAASLEPQKAKSRQ